MSKKNRSSSQAPFPARSAIQACGGTGVVTSKLGITRQTLHNWDVVPAVRCADISALSGIPCEKLRPDIFRLSELQA